MLKYLGKGFLRGVPARDLKDDEVRKFGANYLLRSGLYGLVDALKPEQAAQEPAAIPEKKPRRTRKVKEE